MLDDDVELESSSSDLFRLVTAMDVAPFPDVVGGAVTNDARRYMTYAGDIQRVGDVLYLTSSITTFSSSSSSTDACPRVDLVPNVLLARKTSLLGSHQWDEQLKVGEHEDFFLRAKQSGLVVFYW